LLCGLDAEQWCLPVKLNMGFRHNQRWLVATAILIFVVYAAWSAHTPGQPTTVKDFLFVLEVFGVPFAFFVYAVSWWPYWRGLATGRLLSGSRPRIAVIGSVLGAVSAGLFLLFLPFWNIAVEHQALREYWVIAGALTTIAASLCGIVGAPTLRRPALFSVCLLPFWYFLVALLLKAAMD